MPIQLHDTKTDETRLNLNGNAPSQRTEKSSYTFRNNRQQSIAQLKLQKAADNSLQSSQLSAIQQSAQFPIQRLVISGGDQDNLTFASALPAATEQAGGPVQNWNTANLAGSKRVAIVAHGDTNSISLNGIDYDGAGLADQLVAKNLQPNTRLLLWACRAGMQNMVEGVSVDGSSLVEQTAKKLESSVGVDNVSISGFRGVHMFLAGDNNASRIVDPALTKGNPDTEMGILNDIGKLNMHHVYLSGYFSERYLKMHMKGWKQEDVTMPNGKVRKLWQIDEDVFEAHSDQTRVQFMDKERQAYHAPLVRPEWLESQEKFNPFKAKLWGDAGASLTLDKDFNAATLRESDETRDAMTRTKVVVGLD